MHAVFFFFFFLCNDPGFTEMNGLKPRLHGQHFSKQSLSQRLHETI